jgi:hypothetical protein
MPIQSDVAATAAAAAAAADGPVEAAADTSVEAEGAIDDEAKGATDDEAEGAIDDEAERRRGGVRERRETTEGEVKGRLWHLPLGALALSSAPPSAPTVGETHLSDTAVSSAVLEHPPLLFAVIAGGLGGALADFSLHR